MALPMISRAKKPHPADAGSGFCLSGGGAVAKAARTSNAAAQKARRRRDGGVDCCGSDCNWVEASSMDRLAITYITYVYCTLTER